MTPAAPRLFSLDVLRGVAVLMVLAAHVPLPDAFGHGPGGRLLRLGIYGVPLFFVLSGFLISGLIFAEVGRTGWLDARRFWLRRGFKIWPAYYAAYAAAFALALADKALAGRPLGGKFVEALPNLVFLQNYVWPESRWFASWSLAVEEHFYTALPLVVFALLALRVGVRGLPWVCAAVCVASPLFRHFATDPAVAKVQTHARADALAFGVLLGYAAHHHRDALTAFAQKRIRWLLALPVAALAVPFAVGYSEAAWMRSLGLSFLAVAFTGLVAAAAAHPAAGRSARGPVGWAARLLAWVGTYSYTIYLAQAATILVVFAGGDRLNRLLGGLTGVALDYRGVVFLAATVAWGVVLSYAVERPFLRLRERWVPRAAAVVVTGKVPAMRIGHRLAATRSLRSGAREAQKTY